MPMHAQRTGVLAAAAGLAIGLCATDALAEAKTWTGGGGDGEWANGDNWSPGGAPGMKDSAGIPAGFALIEIRQDDPTVVTVGAQSPVYIGRTLTVTDFASFDGLDLVGTLVCQGPAPSVIASGDVLIDFGRLEVGQFLLANADATMNNAVLRQGEILNRSDLRLTGATNLLPGTKLINDAGGTLIMLSAANFSDRPDPGEFINRGELISTGQFNRRIEYPFTQEQGGSIDVTDGVMEIVADADLAGELGATGSGVLQLRASNGFTHAVDGATFVGDGNVEVRTSNVRLIDATNEMTGSVGLELRSNIAIPGTLTNNGVCTLFSSTLFDGGGARLGERVRGGASFVNGPMGTLNASGTVRIPLTNAGLVRVNSSFNIGVDQTNDPGGRYELSANLVNASQTGTPARFVNRGTVVRPVRDGSFVSSVALPFDQQPGGEVRIEDDGIRFDLGGEWLGGTINLDYQLGNAAASTPKLFVFGSQPFTLGDGLKIEGEGIAELGTRNPAPPIIITGDLELAVNAGLNLPGADNDNGGVYLGDIGGEGRIINTQRVFVEGLLDCNFINRFTTVLEPGAAISGIFINESQVGPVLQRATTQLVGLAVVQNDGVWIIDGGGLSLLGGPGTSFTNRSRFVSVPDGGSQQVAVRFDNQGLVLVDEPGQLSFTGPVDQLFDGRLNGGIWSVGRGGRIVFPSELREIVGPAAIRGDLDEMPELDTIDTVSGGGEIDTSNWDKVGDLLIDEGSTLTSSGSCDIDGDVGVQGGSAARINQDATLAANETTVGQPPAKGEPVYSVIDDIEGVVQLARGETPLAPATLISPIATVHGRLVPGGEGQVGALRIIGNTTLERSAQLMIELGASGHDTLEFDGDLAAAGRVVLTALPGASPQPLDRFTIATVSGASAGEFAVWPRLPGGLRAVAVRTPSGWDAVVARPGDLTTLDTNPGDTGYGVPDGTTDVTDLTFYVEQWIGGALSADMTSVGANPGDPDFGAPDGRTDVTDLTWFVEQWIAAPNRM
ncbi:MAG: GC-type dockerin domain-anchored protein [Planctomycetota bacterium]